MKITLTNALKQKDRNKSINFLCFGVWTSEYLSDEELEIQVFHNYEEKYPKLTMAKIYKMSDKDYKDFLKYINLPSNRLCF